MLSNNLKRLSSFNLPSIPNSRLDLDLEQRTKCFIEKSQKIFSDLLQNSLPKVQTHKTPGLILQTLSQLKPNEIRSKLRSYLQSSLALKSELPNQDLKKQEKLKNFFLETCRKHKISEKQAKDLLSFFETLHLELPETLPSEDFSFLLKYLKRFSEEYKEACFVQLRSELCLLERKIQPLKQKLCLVKSKALISSERKYKIGVMALASQMVGVYCGADFLLGANFGLLGGFVAAGMTAIVSSGVFYSKVAGSERTVKGYLFDLKMRRLVLDENVEIERIQRLQREIDCIRGQILDLN